MYLNTVKLMLGYYIHIIQKVNSGIYFLVDSNTNIIIGIIMSSIVIHIGLRTHIQLQAINQVSLSVINTIVSKAGKPIHDVLFCVLIFKFR